MPGHLIDQQLDVKPPRSTRRATLPSAQSRSPTGRALNDRSAGNRLSPSVRAPMERSFGWNFADVRVHCDEDAAGLVAGLGAEAFTRGRDIYFGAGRYEPATPSGRLLLAHELAHTVQRHAPNTEFVSGPDGPAERAAAAAARRAAAGGRVDVAALTLSRRAALQRQPAPAAPTNQPGAKDVYRFPFPRLSIKDYVDEHVTAVGINLYIGKGVVYLTLDNVKDPVVIDLGEFQAGTVELIPFVPDKPTLAEARARVDPDLVKALIDSGRVPCFFYRRSAGLIWPSLLNEQTMPRTMATLRQVDAAARKDAAETAKFFTEVLLWYVGARFPVRTKVPMRAAPAAALSEEASTAEQLAREMAKKQGKVVVNLGGTGEVADAINLNPLKDQAVKNIPNLVKAGGERVGTLFKPGSVDSIVSNNIVRGQLNWTEAAKGAFTALKSGGKVSIAPYAGDLAAHLAEIQDALRAAGFKDVTAVGGHIVTAVKP